MNGLLRQLAWVPVTGSRRVIDSVLERRVGIETREPVMLESRGVDFEECAGYVPAPS